MADVAARQAAQAGPPEDVPVRVDDFNIHMKHKIKASWQQQWNDSDKHLKNL